MTTFTRVAKPTHPLRAHAAHALIVGYAVAVLAVVVVFSVGVTVPTRLLVAVVGGIAPALVMAWLLLPTVDRPQAADQPERPAP